MENFRQDLTTGSVSKNLIKFSIPFLLANTLQALYNVVNMVVVGHFAGPQSISGVNIGGQIMLLVMSLIIGFSIGGTILIAQYIGAKQYNEEKRVIGTLFSIFIIAAIVITAIMYIFCDPILRLLDTPAEAWSETRAYLHITIGGTIFVLGYNGISAVLRGMGDSKRPLLFVFISIIINVVLDLVFISVLHMGAAGAAWATIIAQAAAMIFSIIYLSKKDFVFDFKLKSFRIDPRNAKLLFKLGLPSAVQTSVVQFSFLAIIGMVNSFGYIATAVNGIATRVSGFATLPGLAMSAAIAAMVGQNIGAKQYERASKTMFTGMSISAGISLVITAIVFIFPHGIMAAFTSDPNAIEMGTSYMRISSYYYVLLSLVFSISGLANGSGHNTFVLFNSLLSSFILRLPLAYLFSHVLGYGLDGIAMGISVAPVGSIIAAVIFYRLGVWKKPRVKLIGVDDTPRDNTDGWE